MENFNIKNYKAIIFDLFHTITSLEGTKAKGKSTSKILGVPRDIWNDQLIKYSKDRLTGKMKDPYEIMAKMALDIDPQITKDKIKEATKIRIKRFSHAIKNIPENTINVLKQLKNKNIKLGLLSNADVTEIFSWNESPISSLFDSVVFSCNSGYLKPQKESYELSLKELEIQAKDCLFVGDGGSDELKGAKKVGMDTLMTTEVIQKLWPEKIKERKKYADFVTDNLLSIII